jgi:tetratricopeptide (TPR) repeat protein
MALSGGQSTKRARRLRPTYSVSISFSRIEDPTDFRNFENILFQVDQYYSSKLGNDPHEAWNSWKASSKCRQIKVSYTFQGDTYTCIFDGLNRVFYRYYLADRYLRKNRTRDAWRLVQEGAEMVRPLLQQESPSFLRELLHHFSGIYSGDYAAIQRQLLHLLTNMSFITYGRGHPVSIICRLLQLLYGKQHVIEQTMKKLHDTFKHHLGEDHSASLSVQDKLCDALMFQKKYAEAERSLQDIIKASERCHGRSARSTRLTLFSLAKLYYLQERYAQAKQILEDVFQRGKEQGEDDAVNICGQRLLGKICMAQRDYSAAKACFCSALWGSLLQYGQKDPRTSRTWTLYQYAKEELQKRRGASKSLTRSPQAVWDISEEPLRCLSRPRSSSLPSSSTPGRVIRLASDVEHLYESGRLSRSSPPSGHAQGTLQAFHAKQPARWSLRTV